MSTAPIVPEVQTIPRTAPDGATNLVGKTRDELAALLIKDGVERPPLEIRYEGFHIPPKFVVGYGLDLDGKFRNLPYVAEVEGAD